MAPQIISYPQAFNRLVDQNGQLTPAGSQAMQLFNIYTAAGLAPMAAAQLIGGQLVEDRNLAPLQVEGAAIPYQDATNLDLVNTLIQGRKADRDSVRP